MSSIVRKSTICPFYILMKARSQRCRGVRNLQENAPRHCLCRAPLFSNNFHDIHSTHYIRLHESGRVHQYQVDQLIDTSKYLDANNEVVNEVLSRDMIVHEDFITVEEEQTLLGEIETHLKRLRYEFDHWDEAIQGFRETERKHWSEANNVVLQRMKDLAFPDQSKLLPYVHVLDIAKDGFIKPHIDARRFCGDTVASLSLLSPSVMRLMLDTDRSKFADVLLARRSFYIMINRARYDYTHEVMEDSRSKFKGHHVVRDRRISVILRNQASDDTS